jgi:hypothetical protein
MQRTLAIAVVFAGAMSALAGPLFPTVIGHDFAFGGYNTDPTIEYSTNGVAPDTLRYTRNVTDHEVVSYWPNWPAGPARPVTDLLGEFGGDLVLSVDFGAQDAPYVGPNGTVDVSLIGTGTIEIWGRTSYLNQTYENLLWKVAFDHVSLYGTSNSMSYVVEGLGTIVDGTVATAFGLLNQRGALRSHLDFVSKPAGWLTPLYDPTSPLNAAVRAAISGETGWLPEPASLGLLAVAAAFLRRR